MSWERALEYASSPAGVGAIVGWLLSWLMEYSPRFAAMAPKGKRLAFAAACLTVALLGACLQAVGGFRAWGWDPLLWQALQAALAAFAMGTLKQTGSLWTTEQRAAYAAWLKSTKS